MDASLNRGRWILAWGAFALTFLWLPLGEAKGGLASLWPSTLAIGLAFLLRNIYVALFLGSLSGILLVQNGNVLSALPHLVNDALVPALSDAWNLKVLMFTVLMGGLVELISRNGGMNALIHRILGRARTPRKAGLSVYFLGWLVFFDGLANAMLVGKSMRPVTDKVGMSREKLSFIVDSTSSPIAGVALISTWVAYEIAMIQQGLTQAYGPDAAAAGNPYFLLIQSLPYRFYNYFMLIIVFLTIWWQRDLGPMWKAERASRQKAQEDNPAPPETPSREGTGSLGKRYWLALGPLILLIAAVGGGLFIQGGGMDQPFGMDAIIESLGSADAAGVMLLATVVTCLVTMILGALFRDRSLEVHQGQVQALLEGMNKMFLPALILILAWMLGGVIKQLDTGSYLVSLLGPSFPVGILPLAVFLLAALVSFSTGTSWGTMAIVMPLAIPLAVQLNAPSGQTGDQETMLIAVIGSVLAGAVFGDHCSPISDTTIVSAFSAQCDTMAHVRTQLPYALLAAVIATLPGYGLSALGVSPWISLVIGLITCCLVIKWAARPYADFPDKP